MRQAMRSFSKEIWLGVFFLGFGLLTLFVWIPQDTDSGLLTKVRRTTLIGDALAPSIAALLLSLSALWLIISSLGGETKSEKNDWLPALKISAILIISVLLMRWTGPFLIEEYRSLRDTLPWKYVGYLLGGSFMIFGLISLVEKRMSSSYLLLAIVITAIIGLIYDLPFEDLLLPPNGDV